jgi:hypothetical protein
MGLARGNLNCVKISTRIPQLNWSPEARRNPGVAKASDCEISSHFALTHFAVTSFNVHPSTADWCMRGRNPSTLLRKGSASRFLQSATAESRIKEAGAFSGGAESRTEGGLETIYAKRAWWAGTGWPTMNGRPAAKDRTNNDFANLVSVPVAPRRVSLDSVEVHSCLRRPFANPV